MHRIVFTPELLANLLRPETGRVPRKVGRDFRFGRDLRHAQRPEGPNESCEVSQLPAEPCAKVDVAAAQRDASPYLDSLPSLGDCFASITAPKIARVKEGIRRFKWWAIAALAILALLALGLLFPRPLRGLITVTVVGRTNTAGMPSAAVAVSNHSRRHFSVYLAPVINNETILFSDGIVPPTLELAPESSGTLSVPDTADARHKKWKLVCNSYDSPGHLQSFLIDLFALLRLRYPDPRHFETDLIVTQ
jgi:hypothetical protein